MITKREINITSFHKLLCNMTQARVFICLNINSKTGPVFLFSPAFNIENVNFITTYLQKIFTQCFHLMYFSCKTTMDKFACSMVFRTIFFIIVYSDISSQPLYENQRQDPITPNRTELYYQKVYGKQEKNQYFTFLSCHLLCRAQSLF